MSQHLVVVDRVADWEGQLDPGLLVTARDYIAHRLESRSRQLKVINLCRSHRYLSTGYYVSLLAEARGDRVIPNVSTVLDLSRKSIYQWRTGALEVALGKRLSEREEESIVFSVHFGRTDEAALQPLADALFEHFPAPILEVELRRLGGWHLHRLQIGPSKTLQDETRKHLTEALNAYLGKRWRKPKSHAPSRYDLAVLHNPEEPMPPSNKRALAAFVKAGYRLGVDVDLITRQDYPQIAEWDALFIRETTSVNHHTFRFAKRAEAEGIVVIDDATSILRCTNKVYLADLLRTHKISAPQTEVLQRDRRLDVERFTYPVVVKIPDGAFSRGVHRVHDPTALRKVARELFQDSDLVLVQEYLPSEFDWRIGLIGGQPLYACRYFMSRGHWQIYHHQSDGRVAEGKSETLPIEAVPQAVVQTAQAAANLIGDGLYGVDLKENPDGVFVIEVNDNPNLDAGIEDAVLRDGLYEAVIREFIRRLESQAQEPRPNRRAR